MEYYYSVAEYVTGTGDNILLLIFGAMAAAMGKIWHTIVQERKYMREHEFAMKQEMKKYEGEKHERDVQYRSEMLEVLRENTAAISASKEVAESLRKALEAHGLDSREITKRIHERLEAVQAVMSEMRAGLARDIRDDAKKIIEAESARLIKRLDDITAAVARQGMGTG